MSEKKREKILDAIRKYRYPVLVVLLGIVLMLLPSGEKKESTQQGSANTAEQFDRAAVQKEMEIILRSIDGVGSLKLMLTVDSGTRQELAQDTTIALDNAKQEERAQTILRSAGSGVEEPIVTNSVYPHYVGALVVCEGAGSAAVRLDIVRAVSALTALPSDKITVIKGKP